MNKREQQFEQWLESSSYELEDEFIQTLPPEDQPKTDDPDEVEGIILNNEEEYLKFCWDKYDEVFDV